MSLLSKFIAAIFAMIMFMLSVTAEALPPMNLPFGVTQVSQEIYNLHMLAFYICCAIGFLVFGALLFILIKYRRSKGAVSKDIHESLVVEIIWTIIPFIILAALVVPATNVLIRIHNTDKPGIDIKITGYQWRWKYEYLDQGISFFSNLSTSEDQINNLAPKSQWFLLEVDHPLVVPIHKKIRLLVTADDVIHSWWVPDLGVKQDGIPGYINENWMIIDKPGIYRGNCAELCGARHAFMPIVVEAVTEEEFNNWVSKQNGAVISETNLKVSDKSESIVSTANISNDELLKGGAVSYDKYCSACHQSNGKGLPPTFPALSGSKIATGPVTLNIKTVLNGVSGTSMQAFGQQLDDKTLAEIITYTRHSWGNDEKNAANKQVVFVQPSAVKEVRNK